MTSILSEDLDEFTADERLEYQDAFQLFDINDDGHITAEELGEVLKELGHDVSEEELREMIAEVDVDGSEEIEFKEFLTLMKRRTNRVNLKEELTKAFQSFDVDQKNSISVEQYKQIMCTGNQRLSEEEAMLLLENAGQAGFKRVYYLQFIETLV